MKITYSATSPPLPLNHTLTADLSKILSALFLYLTLWHACWIVVLGWSISTLSHYHSTTSPLFAMGLTSTCTLPWIVCQHYTLPLLSCIYLPLYRRCRQLTVTLPPLTIYHYHDLDINVSSTIPLLPLHHSATLPMLPWTGYTTTLPTSPQTRLCHFTTVTMHWIPPHFTTSIMDPTLCKFTTVTMGYQDPTRTGYTLRHHRLLAMSFNTWEAVLKCICDYWSSPQKKNIARIASQRCRSPVASCIWDIQEKGRLGAYSIKDCWISISYMDWVYTLSPRVAWYVTLISVPLYHGVYVKLYLCCISTLATFHNCYHGLISKYTRP